VANISVFKTSAISCLIGISERCLVPGKLRWLGHQA